MRTSWRRAVVLGLLGVVAGCQKGSSSGHAAVGGLGTVLAPGSATDLRVTPDGKFALYLADPHKPALQGIPPQMVMGELHVVPTAGGASRKLGNGVTNVPGGYAVSPDSRWVFFLAGYNPAGQSGELELVDLSDPAAAPVDLGPYVTYMLVSPDSKWLAFVSNGVLKVGALGQRAFKDVAGEVENAHFSPDGRLLLFKRTLIAAGSLLAQTVGSAESAKKLGDQVGDYAISPDSKRVAFETRSELVHSTYDLFQAVLPDLKAVKVATGTGGFQYSPDGQWLARTEGQRPEVLGDLYVGPVGGSPARKVADKVQEFEFAPDSTAIAALERYDVSARAGTMTVARLPDGKPAQVGYHVPNFIWGSDGRFLAFLSRFAKPVFSVDLMLYPVGEEKAFKVNPGVFGYSFGPKNAYLLFRTNCLRNGRECDLFKLELTKPKDPPVRIVQGINSWKPADDGQRILVTYARKDTDAYDVAVYDARNGERKTLDQFIVPPALFAAPDGSRVVYIEQGLSRPGVYVSDRVP